MIRTKHQAHVEAIRRGWEKEAGVGRLLFEQDANGYKRICVLHVIAGIAMKTQKAAGAKTWQGVFDRVDHDAERSRRYEEARGQPCPLCFATMRTTSDGKIGPLNLRDVHPRLAGPATSADRARRRQLHRYAAHWPCVEYVDGAWLVLCLACQREKLAAAFVAMGEAISRSWYVSGADFIDAVHEAIPDAFADLPEGLR